MAVVLRNTPRTNPAEGRKGGSVSQEEIAKLAYQLYEERGREPGKDAEDWSRAEQILRARQR